ncbi:MAG: tetratricopeptide repeat protein [Candidatus Binataceae bacterium]|jgi:TolA-binding protein
MSRSPFRLRIGALAAAGVFALGLAGCAELPDQGQPQAPAQASDDTDLRAMIASDQQEIAGLREQVGRLNDQITEIQHNDTGSGEGNKASGSDQQASAGAPPIPGTAPNAQASPAASPGITDTSGNGAAPPGPGGTDAAANGAAPPGPAPSDTTVTNGALPPPPDSGETAGSDSAPPPSAPPPGPAADSGSETSTAGASSGNDSANAADSDNEKDDNDNDENETATAEPPSAPSAPAEITQPPAWQGTVDDQIGAASASSDPAAKSYRAGLIAMKGGLYPIAFGKFQDLQHRYPKSPLSEPAEYYSANALFEMGKYEQAILQFNDLTMRFPGGKYASASLLREAQAFEKINDQVDARLTLQKLLNDHPNSPEAAAAKSMMQGMASG